MDARREQRFTELATALKAHPENEQAWDILVDLGLSILEREPANQDVRAPLVDLGLSILARAPENKRVRGRLTELILPEVCLLAGRVRRQHYCADPVATTNFLIGEWYERFMSKDSSTLGANGAEFFRICCGVLRNILREAARNYRIKSVEEVSSFPGQGVKNDEEWVDLALTVDDVIEHLTQAGEQLAAEALQVCVFGAFLQLGERPDTASLGTWPILKRAEVIEELMAHRSPASCPGSLPSPVPEDGIEKPETGRSQASCYRAYNKAVNELLAALGTHRGQLVGKLGCNATR
jgi:hypothetical protein